MQPQTTNINLPQKLTSTSKNLSVIVAEGGLSIHEISKTHREEIKMLLVAGFTDLNDFFKVTQKMTPKECGELCVMVLNHETFSTYSLEMFSSFFTKCKQGELGKSFNRFDVPTIFEMLWNFNGMIELERELVWKDQKQALIKDNRETVKGLKEIWKGMGLDVNFGRTNQKPKPVEKTPEIIEHDKFVQKCYTEFDELYKKKGFEVSGMRYVDIGLKDENKKVVLLSQNEYAQHKLKNKKS